MTTVRIKNRLAQRVKVTLLRLSDGKPVEVSLDPHGALPNRRRPQEISVDAVTPYTQGLADKGHLQLTHLKAAPVATDADKSKKGKSKRSGRRSRVSADDVVVEE